MFDFVDINVLCFDHFNPNWLFFEQLVRAKNASEQACFVLTDSTQTSHVLNDSTERKMRLNQACFLSTDSTQTGYVLSETTKTIVCSTQVWYVSTITKKIVLNSAALCFDRNFDPILILCSQSSRVFSDFTLYETSFWKVTGKSIQPCVDHVFDYNWKLF